MKISIFVFTFLLLIPIEQALPKVRQNTHHNAKIVHLNEFDSSSKDIILVSGYFDIIHIGHIDFLKRSKERGGQLVVALESDEMSLIRKGKCTINNQMERAIILSNLRSVDTVVILPQKMDGYQDYLRMIQIIKPKIMISSADSSVENKRKIANIVGAKFILDKILITGRSSNIIRETAKNYDSRRKNKKCNV